MPTPAPVPTPSPSMATPPWSACGLDTPSPTPSTPARSTPEACAGMPLMPVCPHPQHSCLPAFNTRPHPQCHAHMPSTPMRVPLSMPAHVPLLTPACVPLSTPTYTVHTRSLNAHAHTGNPPSPTLEAHTCVYVRTHATLLPSLIFSWGVSTAYPLPPLAYL
ncbi:hypothetical protein OF83DRAFT_1178975 [Amylostereum chailletii]|nr:hypothetical protein OF83DRAFT_1178975 [Amylostereum chailletii]